MVAAVGGDEAVAACADEGQAGGDEVGDGDVGRCGGACVEDGDGVAEGLASVD